MFPRNKRIIFVANGLYGAHISGGDVHFFHMARAAVEAGMHPVFIGGQALGDHLRAQHIPGDWWPSNDRRLSFGPGDPTRLSAQIGLFRAYVQQCRNTRTILASNLKPGDRLYAASDFWFDVLPVSRARSVPKAMILHMWAPSWRELLCGTRPDVVSGRRAALHSRLSQSVGLFCFRRCFNKRVLYVHPHMGSRLRQMGFKNRELLHVTNGVDLEAIRSVGSPERVFDVVWLGRLHRQKGLEHLAALLNALAQTLENFKALVIGDVEDYLRSRLSNDALGAVTFAGLVTGSRRFHFLKRARLFVMPSRHESWGIVMAEALACQTPVLAYDLPAYRAVFNDLITRIPCFEKEAFIRAAREGVSRARSGEKMLNEDGVSRFVQQHDWKKIGRRFWVRWYGESNEG